jgi:HK97 gp10 family phage protein
LAMSNPVEVKVSGLDKLQKALEQEIPKKAKAAVRSGLRAGALVIKKAVFAEAPKDSGFLSEHIDVKMRVRGNDLTGSAFVGPNAKAVYQKPEGSLSKKWRAKPAWVIARFLESGTHKMAANPFMTRAFEAYKQKAIDAVIEKLKEILR